MPNPFYLQYLESQKAMYEEWQKHMQSPFFKSDSAATDVPGNPMAFYAKMFDSPENLMKKANDSYKSYYAVLELWNKLAEAGPGVNSKTVMDIYDTWSTQYFALLKNNLAAEMPAPVREFREKLIHSMESSNTMMRDYFNTWAEYEEPLKKAFQDSLGNGPQGYIEFLEVWQKSYEESLGKLMDAPTYGRDMDFWKQQKASFDRFIKYNIANAKFHASLFEIAQDATKQVLNDYVEMQSQGNQPKTFEEFYKYWSKVVSSTYEKVLFSENLSVLSGNVVDAMSRFKLEYDKLCEMYLKNMPVPKNSDMDDLYKTVYELKKELRALKKEIRSNGKNSNA